MVYMDLWEVFDSEMISSPCQRGRLSPPSQNPPTVIHIYIGHAVQDVRECVNVVQSVCACDVLHASAR